MEQFDESLFRRIDRNDEETERIDAPVYSYWKSVFRIFFRKKINIVFLILLVVLFFFAFLMPLFFTYDAYENVAIPSAQHLSPKEAQAFFDDYSLKYILGTGKYGNSIFYGLMAASRTSLLLSFACAAINMFVGVVIGMIWGYSKKVDAVMLVFYNIIANVPYILLISVLVYVVGSGFGSFIFALTITGWLGIAFFLRTQVLIIRDREYNLASRCLGTPLGMIITKNIMPFMIAVIVTLLAEELPSYISMEVFLSYIGIGISSAIPSLGHMINDGQGYFMSCPWEFWPPVFISAYATIVLYLLGQNLADASDPKTHM